MCVVVVENPGKGLALFIRTKTLITVTSLCLNEKSVPLFLQCI